MQSKQATTKKELKRATKKEFLLKKMLNILNFTSCLKNAFNFFIFFSFGKQSINETLRILIN